MSQQTLKELFKHPFTVAGISSSGLCIRDNTYPYRNILEVREGGNAMADFTTAALNEKWERDFGEPLRRRERMGRWKCRCPKCLQDAEDFYAFCPHCGHRLLPPCQKAENE
jgi:hypothetical protein